MPKKRRGASNIDWSAEILHCVGLVGKAFVKLLTYVLNILITVLLIGVITGIVVGGAFGLYVLNEIDASVDSIDFLKVESQMTTQIYYRDYTYSEEGELVEVEKERLSGEESRIYAAYEEFPEDLVNAVIAIEDKRFWTHPGVDLITTVRCTLEYFTGSGTAGASSITQQLIKNVTGDDDVTIQRKAQEIMRALSLERTMTKTQILELYLNTVYFGHRSYGISSAAYNYFGKDVKDLTLVECAAIVGITQNPSKWDPYTHPENNLERRQIVLTAMRDQKLITEEEYLEAWHSDINLVGDEEDEKDEDDKEETGDEQEADDGVYSWYTECVIDETIDLLMEEYGYTEEIAFTKLYTGGLQIVTAQDHKLQEILEEFYENDANFEKLDDSLIQYESSFVLIDPKTGDVVAVVGGRGKKTANRILNYATGTTRPSGSVIKPVTIYGPGIEYGILDFGSVEDDTPVNFGEEKIEEDGTITYTRPGGYPANYPVGYTGRINTHTALALSVNTFAYKTAMKLGVDRIFHFAKNLCHIDSLIESQEVDGYTLTDKAIAPLALGQQSYGVTNVELTAAYTIFANEGVYNHPRFVTEIYDSEWNLLIDNAKPGEIVISESTASLMTLMMEETISYGTANTVTLKEKIDIAAKTGTTQSEGDRWMIGYTPYYLGGVWIGYSIPQSLTGFSRNPVLPTWDGVMTRVHQHIFEEAEKNGEKVKEFEISDNIRQATYCADSGKLITEACLLDPRGNRRRTGYYTDSTLPTEACDVHVKVMYDAKTGAIATPNCPPENCKEVGLLNIRRSFICPVTITDAQYVFWDIFSMGIEPAGTVNEPFFINAIPENTYVGISKGDTQYNHSCQVHVYVPPVTDPPTTDPPIVPPDTTDGTSVPIDTLPPTTAPPSGEDPPSGEGQGGESPGSDQTETTGPPSAEPPSVEPSG